MPYKSAYNKELAQQVRIVPEHCGSRERKQSLLKQTTRFLRKWSRLSRGIFKVHGGNGFAAATVEDLGFEPTLGATSGDDKPVKRRTVRVKVEEARSAAGVSTAGVSAAGALAGAFSAAGASSRGVSTGATKRNRRKQRRGGV